MSVRYTPNKSLANTNNIQGSLVASDVNEHLKYQ